MRFWVVELPLDELAHKYGLPRPVVMDVAETAIANSLTKAFRSPVTCRVDDNGLRLIAYLGLNDPKAVELQTISKKLRRDIAYPITTPGNLARVAQITDERQRKLQENQDEFAMVYFSRPDCSYCGEQSKILDWFTKTTNWTVKTVNINDNPGLAAKFNIETTPTIIIIQKGNQDYFPVSVGVISADEIEDKTYRAVRLLKGEITPEEYSLYDFQRGGSYDTNKRK